MWANEYFQQLKTLKANCKQAEDDIKEMKIKAISLRSQDFSKDRVDGGEHIQIADMLINIAEAERFASSQHELYNRFKNAILEEIKCLSTLERSIVIYFYIEELSYTQIALKANIGRSKAYRTLQSAIKNFGRTYKKELKKIKMFVNVSRM